MDPTPPPIPGQLDLVPGDLDTQTAAALAELDRLRELAAERMASTVHGVAGAATAWRTAEARLTEAVAVARAAGATWQQIGDACGITRQAAWQRWGGTDRG